MGTRLTIKVSFALETNFTPVASPPLTNLLGVKLDLVLPQRSWFSCGFFIL